jgi:formate dehydrogenase
MLARRLLRGAEPQSFGVNRNLLVGNEIDPLSQTSALSSTYVGVERV